MTETDKNVFKEQILVFKTIVSPILRKGNLFRLWDPFKVTLEQAYIQFDEYFSA